MSLADYLKHCEERLSNEYVRCNTYLDVSSRTALIRLVERTLLYKHSQLILERGFEPILNKVKSNLKKEREHSSELVLNLVRHLSEPIRRSSTHVRSPGES